MICRTGQLCIVQSPTMNFIFFTISNLNYTVFVSLAHIYTTCSLSLFIFVSSKSSVIVIIDHVVIIRVH